MYKDKLIRSGIKVISDFFYLPQDVFYASKRMQYSCTIDLEPNQKRKELMVERIIIIR
jgi:hypothetical protein